MKHNNVIANQHFRKDWQRYVRTWFNQPAKKLRRRALRAAKAKKMMPRPLRRLRPIVHVLPSNITCDLVLARVLLLMSSRLPKFVAKKPLVLVFLLTIAERTVVRNLSSAMWTASSCTRASLWSSPETPPARSTRREMPPEP